MALTQTMVELLMLALIPSGAAVFGLVVGRVLRGPRSLQNFKVTATEAFVVRQAAGTVRGQRTSFTKRKDRKPDTVVLEIQVPADMPAEQVGDSVRQFMKAEQQNEKGHHLEPSPG